MKDLKTYLIQTFHCEESFAEVVAKQIMERFDKGGSNTDRKDEVAKIIFKRIYGSDCEWGKTGTDDDSSWRRAEEQCLRDAKQIEAQIKELEAENDLLKSELLAVTKGADETFVDGMAEIAELKALNKELHEALESIIAAQEGKDCHAAYTAEKLARKALAKYEAKSNTT